MNYIKTVMNKAIEITDIVSIHYFEYAKDFTYSGEFHDFWELVYVDKGELLITAGAHETILPAGHLFLHLGPVVVADEACDGCIEHNEGACEAEYQHCSTDEQNFDDKPYGAGSVILAGC